MGKTKKELKHREWDEIQYEHLIFLYQKGHDIDYMMEELNRTAVAIIKALELLAEEGRIKVSMWKEKAKDQGGRPGPLGI